MKASNIVSKITECADLEEAGPYIAAALVYGVNNMDGGDFLDLTSKLADELTFHFDVPDMAEVLDE
jgi:hypothetical protein